MFALDGETPPCEGCENAEVPLLPVNAEAVALWRLLDHHARDFVGMNAAPGPLRLEAVRGECDRGADPDGLFGRVMLVESLVWPARMRKMEKAGK